MIQDIAPHIYHNEMSWQAPAPDDYVLLFSEKGEVCAGCTDGHLALPAVRLTGAELQNTAVAEAGFSLDLARSRYLDINVRRAVLVETANGVIEDERFNRPAKDGDRYTQEGIYTISVSNRYTGESTTKTIFVGSQELLETYVRNGFSLERLK